ncbi:MAG: amino acid dehydrogenase [Chloroflexi bacterium]|nr:amino acid dehydrogenase [Chloroflexota bacterium]
MPKALRDAVRRALANPALREALDRNAARRRAARERARASLPQPWDVMRHDARTMRLRVLDRWDTLLDQFVQRVRAHGVIVHHAQNAPEARHIILDLARDRQVRRVVKSKSMLTEEIALNPALQAQGIEVIETDLGEYIVQLRGERPAHIITPAVHLRREDVARTFAEKLGIPYTEDVATLTAVARQRLRDAFLTAEMGISGVNFGVAETGTLVIVTNEGNGRMVTTLPRIHVAVMGMERLVPTLADLALMLELLPRSATGQVLTVYVSLLHGPRGPHDPDGPLERHLILVDNGRRNLAQTGLRDILTCIRCGACLNACPVFQEIGGHAYVGVHGEPTPYPGPMGIAVSAGLFGGETFGPMSQLCTLCGACAEACPVAIPLPELILRVRAGEPQPDPYAARPAPRGAEPSTRALLWAFTRAAEHPRAFRALQGPLRALVRAGGDRWPVPWMRGVQEPLPEVLSHPPGAMAGAEEPTDAAAAQPPSRPGASAMDDLWMSFLRAWQQVDGRVHSLPEGEDPARALAAWMRAQGWRRVFAWAEDALPFGVVPALRAAGLEVVHQPDPNADVGLTAATLAIAETGSILIPGGPGRPLTASLLPPAHVALLSPQATVERLAQGLAHPEWHPARAAVLITGPSRTADIEMTLTIGVHGPAAVWVVPWPDDA